jgi:hypothetical protein
MTDAHTDTLAVHFAHMAFGLFRLVCPDKKSPKLKSRWSMLIGRFPACSLICAPNQ